MSQWYLPVLGTFCATAIQVSLPVDASMVMPFTGSRFCVGRRPLDDGRARGAEHFAAVGREDFDDGRTVSTTIVRFRGVAGLRGDVAAAVGGERDEQEAVRPVRGAEERRGRIAAVDIAVIDPGLVVVARATQSSAPFLPAEAGVIVEDFDEALGGVGFERGLSGGS
jgi:hypothetical protein